MRECVNVKNASVVQIFILFYLVLTAFEIEPTEKSIKF